MDSIALETPFRTNHNMHPRAMCLLRALSKEIGSSNLALGRALNDEGGWKGRAQQIVMLHARVKQLEARLRSHGKVSQRACRRLCLCSVVLCAKSTSQNSRYFRSICFLRVFDACAKVAIEYTLDSFARLNVPK